VWDPFPAARHLVETVNDLTEAVAAAFERRRHHDRGDPDQAERDPQGRAV
jgi:hypothetical protein